LVNIPGDPQLLALQNRIGILITPTGVQTESPVTPVQSQTEPTPVQSQTEPTPVQSQTEPTPVQSQTEPTPVQSQTEPTPVQSQTEPAPVQTQQNTATEIAKRTTKSATHFKEIQRLRAQGKVTAAKKLAEQDLKNHPDDIDTMLLLGLIANQQHNYKQADLYLNRVLKEVPTYVDARIGLITTKRAQGKHKEALQLYNVGLKLTPSNKELLAVRRNSPPSPALKPEPSAKVTHPAIQKADYYLNHQQDLIALHVIKRVLKEEPNNTALWLKKGEIERLLNWYPQAADSYHHALKINPELKEAKGLLVEIEELTPYYTHGLNEIGLYTDNFYVSDLSKVWDYTSLYMGRDTDYGKIVGKINFASRLQHSAAQYEINYSPRLSRNVYFDLVAAYSNEPMLFPTYTYGGEGFLNIPKLFEVSAGAKQHNIEATQASTYFTTYTGSIDKGLGNYWFAFRTSHFIPKTHNSSTLYTGTVRRYFTTVDHYLSATVGAGHSPDISDLITVNFLVIKNNFATLNYEFPIFNHQVIVDIGGSYQRWQYPSGLIRNLYGANVGGRYRF
jgi:YaiO family outer membrane protein